MTEELKETGRRYVFWNMTVRQASLLTGAVAVSFLLGVSAAISTADLGNAAEVPGPGFGAVQAGSFANLVESVSPAVVSIEVEGEEAVAALPFSRQLPDRFEEFFRRFGQESPWDNAPRSRPVRSAGAGFIISSDGYVVTNNHVIDSANEIAVTLHDGRDVVRGVKQFGPEVANRPVGDLMTRKVVTCDIGEPLEKILNLMDAHQIRHVPITDGGNLCGIISMLDVVKYRLREIQTEAEALKEYVAGSA